MFGLRDALFKYAGAAQLAEMGRIGEAFTDLAGAGEGEQALRKFIQLLACQPRWTQFHFDAMDYVVRKGMKANVIYGPLMAAVKKEPGNRNLQYMAGLFFQSFGDLGQAMQFYRNAIQLLGKDAVAYHNLGSAYYVKGEREKAIEAWKTAVKLDGRLAEPHFALGLLLGNMGRQREAIRHFEQFNKLAYPGLEGYKRDALMQIQMLRS